MAKRYYNLEKETKEYLKACEAKSVVNQTNIKTLNDFVINRKTRNLNTTFLASSPIILNGLVLWLDAGVSDSYPAGGTVWKDLAGSNNLTLINSPSWNTFGYFSTSSTGYFTGNGSATIPIGNSNYTMMAWVRQNGTWGNARGIITIGGFGVTNGSNALRTASNNTVGNFIHYWWANDLSVSNNNASLSVGTWFMVTAQFDGTTRRVWANTTNVGSDTPGSSHNVASTIIQVGRANNTEYFQGDIAVAQIYNRALTPTEILQNYNAMKGRFGL